MNIKVNGKTVKTKHKVQRNPLFVDEKYTGTEPVWDTERASKMDDAEYAHNLRASLNYYNYFYSQKDAKKYVVEYLKANDYTVQQIKSFERAGDRSIPMTVCSLIMAARVGMPLKEKHIRFINECVLDSISHSSDDSQDDIPTVQAAVPQKPTIQDRMNEKTAETIGELDGNFDEVCLGPTKFKHYDFLLTNNVPQSQLSKYEESYARVRTEFLAVQDASDPQLTEGYSNFKPADIKRIIKWLDELQDAIVQYRNVKKATKKQRTPRSVSKEKLVAKLKYAKDDKTNKLVSINPTEIIGASELWVFNVRTRKIGKYVADSHVGTLGVSGTSITGYDETFSICKTLRKPDVQLKEFAKCGKVQLRKFLSDIKATETKLSGRINQDTVLLRAA
jgi:hypothetical protein